MGWFHIHRFKLIDIHYEKPLLDVDGNHLSFSGSKIYWDLETWKCRCGKEKKDIQAFYSANEARIPISDSVTALRLIDKRAIL
jgi:hypothetical protein